MNVLYDHQMFAIQRFGGITRVFIELMRELSRVPSCRIHWFRGLHLDGYVCDDFIPRLASYSAASEPPADLKRASAEEANRTLFERFAGVLSEPCDVYHPTYYDPALLARFSASKGKVVTVYDLILEKYLAHLDRFRPAREAKRALVERADLVFAISKNTARDTVELLRVDPARIRVTPLASRISELPVISLPPAFAGAPYFLYVGTRSKYKNFDVLIRAFAASARLRRDFKAVCVGGPGPFAGAELDALGTYRLRDRFVHVDGDDRLLRALYSKATALVYTSRYEGFGLPPLEAMQCGCPVICCMTSSLPEVVGDAALAFDPDAPDELAARMVEVADCSSVREQCVARGHTRASLFSWERTAHATMAGYREVSGLASMPEVRP